MFIEDCFQVDWYKGPTVSANPRAGDVLRRFSVIEFYRWFMEEYDYNAYCDPTPARRTNDFIIQIESAIILDKSLLNHLRQGVIVHRGEFFFNNGPSADELLEWHEQAAENVRKYDDEDYYGVE